MHSELRWISSTLLAGWIAFGGSTPAFGQLRFAAPAPDEARDLFNVAQKLYDQDRLEEAEKTFREVVRRFPRNDIVDRADYYLIRSLNEQGKRSEALRRIQVFPRTYPKSKWRTDVEELRIRLTNQVSPVALRAIVPQALPVPPLPPPGQAPATPSRENPVRVQVLSGLNHELQSLQQAFFYSRQAAGTGEPVDMEVALQQEIMRAVFRNSPERAIEIATERLKGNPGDPLVMSSLHMIAQSRSAEALPVLLSIAKNAATAKARKDAIFWISESKANRDLVVDALVGLLPSVGDEEAESLSFALGQVRNAKASQALAAIAQDKGKSQRVRDNALFWIGESRTPNRVSLLEEVYKNSMDNAKLRIQALFALSEARDAQAVPVLRNIASADPDIEVRKQAVFWLSEIRTPEARQALESLLQRR